VRANPAVIEAYLGTDEDTARHHETDEENRGPA
jgi:hypothetical protein